MRLAAPRKFFIRTIKENFFSWPNQKVVTRNLFSTFLSYASRHFASIWSIHHPISFFLKWEYETHFGYFQLDIPWFAFLKMFQTAQVSWMSRWVPERRIKEKNSDTGYLAMFSLAQNYKVKLQNYTSKLQHHNIFREDLGEASIQRTGAESTTGSGLCRIALWGYFG